MLLTIPLILLTCGLALANAWISGHAEELAAQVAPVRQWLPKAGFWLSVIGLSATLFAVLIPILTSFVDLESDGIFLDPVQIIVGIWPLYLVLVASLAVSLVLLVNSVRAPKPKRRIEQGGRRYGYYGYPRSYFIFLPMHSHRRIAASPRYYPAVAGGYPRGGLGGGFGSGGVDGRGGIGGGFGSGAGVADSYARGGVGGPRGGVGGPRGGVGGGFGGDATGAASGAVPRGGTGGGFGGNSNGGSKSSYRRSNERSMDANAGLVMLAVLAITGGYQSAKLVRKMGGKRQAEINHLWRTAEAQRVIREHDEEQARKLDEQFEPVLAEAVSVMDDAGAGPVLDDAGAVSVMNDAESLSVMDDAGAGPVMDDAEPELS